MTITILWRRCFISASSVRGSLPGAGVAGAGLRGLVLMGILLVENDVVDETDGADAYGGSEDGRIERSLLDVVDVEAVELRARQLGIPRRERPRQGERALPLLGREQLVA